MVDSCQVGLLSKQRLLGRIINCLHGKQECVSYRGGFPLPVCIREHCCSTGRSFQEFTKSGGPLPSRNFLRGLFWKSRCQENHYLTHTGWKAGNLQPKKSYFVRKRNSQDSRGLSTIREIFFQAGEFKHKAKKQICAGCAMFPI
jgi:hypothetical protein